MEQPSALNQGKDLGLPLPCIQVRNALRLGGTVRRAPWKSGGCSEEIVATAVYALRKPAT